MQKLGIFAHTDYYLGTSMPFVGLLGLHAYHSVSKPVSAAWNERGGGKFWFAGSCWTNFKPTVVAITLMSTIVV